MASVKSLRRKRLDPIAWGWTDICVVAIMRRKDSYWDIKEGSSVLWWEYNSLTEWARQESSVICSGGVETFLSAGEHRSCRLNLVEDFGIPER